jgi:hypothetical protein
MGAAAGSSAADLHPGAGASEKSLPGPATDDLTPERQPILLAAPGTLHRHRTADGVKRSLLDDGEDRGTLSRPGLPP